MNTTTPVRLAILDLYNRAPNQGMRCIKTILDDYALQNDRSIDYRIFETRYTNEVPRADAFDIYLSTGGPGSPYDGEGLPWERKYFDLIDGLWNHNQRNTDQKKHVFFICHSLQMMCRHFSLGEVTRRRSTAFGIFPIHKTEAGDQDPVFEGLPEPFYAVDSRDWQVVQPNQARLESLGGTVLAIEKDRPHVDLERAVMAIRLSGEFFGTQFHPEADAEGMSTYFQQPEKREQITALHGEAKYQEMIRCLHDPNRTDLTQRTILPNFLNLSIGALQETA
ncbi:MAG: GMP synthase [Ferruginibacter sp.]|nr:GMP synthase [Cytophagales bacterium]